VARQRARGERAFYHFLDDDALVEICEGRLVSGPSIHVAEDVSEKNLSIEARAARLRAEVGGLVEELSALEVRRSAAEIEAFRAEEEANAERLRPEGRRAKREALEKDRRALENRFSRWFPNPKEVVEANAVAGAASSDAEAVLVVLSTIAEVVSEMGGTELSRRADAIDLLERLLPDAALTPSRWFKVLGSEPDAVRAGLAAVEAAVGRVGGHYAV